MSGGIILVREPRQPDVLDVRDLIASAVDAFCEEFGVSGAEARKKVFQRFSAEARDMAETIG